MIEQPKNKNYNIIIPNQTSISLSNKTSKENIPNIEKTPEQGEKSPIISEKLANLNEIESLKNNSTIPSIEQKYENEKLGENIINLSGKPKESKDFTEKKRRRKNKCSYSSKKQKKSKNKIIIPPLIDLSKKNSPITPSQIPIDIDIEKKILSEFCSSSGAIKFDPNAEKDQIANDKTAKKKSRISEKEIIANAEKEFMDKLNQEYSDEQYNKDMEQILKEEKSEFMRKNFPIMYRKDKYYLYNILLNKRRTQDIHFINPKTLSRSLQESKKLQTLYLNEEPEKIENNSRDNSYDDKNIKNSQKQNLENNTEEEQLEHIKKNLTENKNNMTTQKKNNNNNNNNKVGGMSETSPSEFDVKNLENNQSIDDNNSGDKIQGLKFKKLYEILPKQVWAVPEDEKELDIDLFYDDCVQIWPFDECTFVKEIALEFLMKNDYSTEVCLKRMKDFVSFMKKRANELNISILNKNEKNIKNYTLRKTKYN